MAVRVNSKHPSLATATNDIYDSIAKFINKNNTYLNVPYTKHRCTIDGFHNHLLQALVQVVIADVFGRHDGRRFGYDPDAIPTFLVEKPYWPTAIVDAEYFESMRYLYSACQVYRNRQLSSSTVEREREVINYYTTQLGFYYDLSQHRGFSSFCERELGVYPKDIF